MSCDQYSKIYLIVRSILGNVSIFHRVRLIVVYYSAVRCFGVFGRAGDLVTLFPGTLLTRHRAVPGLLALATAGELLSFRRLLTTLGAGTCVISLYLTARTFAPEVK